MGQAAKRTRDSRSAKRHVVGGLEYFPCRAPAGIFLGIPVAYDKLEGPATQLTFLGITLDSTQQLSLPLDKQEDILHSIQGWRGHHKATKRELLSLIGKLSFSAKVVPAGRLFLRHLIDLSTTAKKLHHHIRITADAREDLA